MRARERAAPRRQKTHPRLELTSTFGERGWLHDDVLAGAAAAFYCAAKGALEHVLDHYTGAVEVRAVDSWGALYRRLP